MDLDKSSISLSLPMELGLLTSLYHLKLSRNWLGGSIPTEIGLRNDLPSIDDIGRNSLNSTIPSKIV